MPVTEGENGSPRWRWEHESEMQRLRLDHENMSREFQAHRLNSNQRFDRMEADFRLLLTVPLQIDNLVREVRELNEKFDTLATSTSTGRRADWNMALVAIGIILSVMLGSATFLVSLLRTGVIH